MAHASAAGGETGGMHELVVPLRCFGFGRWTTVSTGFGPV
jgi:hypothetical protein